MSCDELTIRTCVPSVLDGKLYPANNSNALQSVVVWTYYEKQMDHNIIVKIKRGG